MRSEIVNLREYPRGLIEVERAQSQITLGDLHGNAMKLLFTLIKEGILSLKESDYRKLWAIYDTPTSQLTQVQLDEFSCILEHAQYKTHKSLRLIGDVLADRGANDWFTLTVLGALHRQKVSFEILDSNHDAVFILAMNGRNSRVSPIRSLENLQQLLRRFPDRDAEVQSLYHIYLQHFKALSYSREGEKLTIFTHAPVGLETIEGVARELGVSYDESTPESLASSIDQINKTFVEGIQRADFCLLDNLQNPASSLFHLMWNRAVGMRDGRWRLPPLGYRFVESLKLAPSNHSFLMTFVHGHDGDYVPYERNRINLDNDLGKGEDSAEGEYRTYRETVLPQPAPEEKGGGEEQKAAGLPSSDAANRSKPLGQCFYREDEENIAECDRRLERMCRQVVDLAHRHVDATVIRDLREVIGEIDVVKQNLRDDLSKTHCLEDRRAAYRSFIGEHSRIMSEPRHQRLKEFSAQYRKKEQRFAQQIGQLIFNVLQTATGIGLIAGVVRLALGKSYGITGVSVVGGQSKTGRLYGGLFEHYLKSGSIPVTNRGDFEGKGEGDNMLRIV